MDTIAKGEASPTATLSASFGFWILDTISKGEATPTARLRQRLRNAKASPTVQVLDTTTYLTVGYRQRLRQQRKFWILEIGIVRRVEHVFHQAGSTSIQNPKLALSVAVGEASPLAIVSKIQNLH